MKGTFLSRDIFDFKKFLSPKTIVSQKMHHQIELLLVLEDKRGIFKNTSDSTV